jgi:hypothetical protein
MSATAKKFSRSVASKRYVRASVKDKFAREYEGLDEEPTTVEIEAAKVYFEAKDKLNTCWVENYRWRFIMGEVI